MVENGVSTVSGRREEGEKRGRVIADAGEQRRRDRRKKRAQNPLSRPTTVRERRTRPHTLATNHNKRTRVKEADIRRRLGKEAELRLSAGGFILSIS